MLRILLFILRSWWFHRRRHQKFLVFYTDWSSFSLHLRRANRRTVVSQTSPKHVNPKKYNSLIVEVATICFTAAIMCTTMSFLATILYNGIIAVGMNGAPLDNFLINFIPSWCQKVVLNFPFALLTQLFVIQPLVRKIFATYFKYKAIRDKTIPQELPVVEE